MLHRHPKLTPKIINREHGSNWRGPPADGRTDKWKDRKRMIMSTSQQHLQMGSSLAVCQYISLEPQQCGWSHWQLQPNTFLSKSEPWVDRCIVIVILMSNNTIIFILMVNSTKPLNMSISIIILTNIVFYLIILYFSHGLHMPINILRSSKTAGCDTIYSATLGNLWIHS